jgi:hypothetical protein
MTTTAHCNPYSPQEQYANYRRLRRLLESLLSVLPDDQADELRRHLETHCAYCGKPLNVFEQLDDRRCAKHSYEQMYSLAFAVLYSAEVEAMSC